MKVQEAINKARLEAIQANYERVKAQEEWGSISKDMKYAYMTLECGLSRQALIPYLKELGIEL